MDDRLAQQIAGRLARLERDMLQLRIGEVTDDEPLSVELGGGTPYTEGVRSIQPVAVGQIVAALVKGNAPPLILGGNGRQTFGATFPADAQDGDEHIYPFTTSGVMWRFRYRAAGASGKKWEFSGGPPLYDEVTTAQTTASTSYAALATVGPSLVLPFAGDYDIEIGADVFNSGANFSYMSYGNGGTAANDADAFFPSGTAAVHGSATRRKTGLAAAATTAVYRVAAGTGTFQRRFMRITPVRVG